MAGRFELFTDSGGSCRVRLVDGHGRELAVSVPYSDSRHAVQGINALREVAGTALIEDHTSDPMRVQAGGRSRSGGGGHSARRAK